MSNIRLSLGTVFVAATIFGLVVSLFLMRRALTKANRAAQMYAEDPLTRLEAFSDAQMGGVKGEEGIWVFFFALTDPEWQIVLDADTALRKEFGVTGSPVDDPSFSNTVLERLRVLDYWSDAVKSKRYREN